MSAESRAVAASGDAKKVVATAACSPYDARAMSALQRIRSGRRISGAGRAVLATTSIAIAT